MYESLIVWTGSKSGLFNFLHGELSHGQAFGRIGLKFGVKVAQIVPQLLSKFQPPTYFTFSVVVRAANPLIFRGKKKFPSLNRSEIQIFLKPGSLVGISKR